MKKLFVLALVMLMVSSVLLCGAGAEVPDGEGEEDFIAYINGNSNFGICGLLEEYTDKLDEKLEQAGGGEIDNFMSKDYYWREDSGQPFSLMYGFYGYPDDESPYFLTTIEFMAEPYNFLGIKVGDTAVSAYEALEKAGFEQADEEFKTLAKDGVEVDIFEAEGLVESVAIDIQTEYLGNNIY